MQVSPSGLAQDWASWCVPPIPVVHVEAGSPGPAQPGCRLQLTIGHAGGPHACPAGCEEVGWGQGPGAGARDSARICRLLGRAVCISPTPSVSPLPPGRAPGNVERGSGVSVHLGCLFSEHQAENLSDFSKQQTHTKWPWKCPSPRGRRLSKAIGGVTTDPVGASHPDSGKAWLMQLPCSSCLGAGSEGRGVGTRPGPPAWALGPRGGGARVLALPDPDHVLPRDTVLSALDIGFRRGVRQCHHRLPFPGLGAAGWTGS